MTYSEPNAETIRKPVYALESIPELIGRRQYRDLLKALGQTHLHGDMPSGEEFAQIVTRAAFSVEMRRHRDAWEERQRSDRNHQSGSECVDFAGRLKTARMRAGYSSASNAAAALGTVRSTYAAHENGQNRPSHLDFERYANFFNVSVVWLAFGDEYTA